MRHDVAIVGGGPAGCATALSLRSHAPELSVLLVEGTTYGDVRPGETLPPVAMRMLEHLDVVAAFEAQSHRATYATATAWGDVALVENDFIYGARGNGWHLDRAAFDALLARQAEVRGASIIRGVRVTTVSGAAGAWTIGLANATAVHARMVIDATGSRAAIARHLRARPVTTDRLTGFACFYEERETREARTLVEAFRDGWWYTAALPANRRIAVCMTDADVARRLELARPERWAEHLAATTHVATAVRGAVRLDPMLVRAARSRILEPAAGRGWLAVGDAASSVDPLSSQGISRALRSGIFASYTIADLLSRGSTEASERYQIFVRKEFTRYLGERSKYYAMERRWPKSEFWHRRR